MPSKIEWTTETWNPTTGCDQVSPGCDNCYALAMSARLKAMGQAKYQRDGRPETSGPGFGITMHDSELRKPETWRKPRRVFVDSMSDLFHPGVDDEFIARVWQTMRATPQHTYQILTKRPRRARAWLDRCADSGLGWITHNGKHPDAYGDIGIVVGDAGNWPLPNVWLGTSVEDQRRADERIPELLDSPAAVRFLSCEPLLGPVDLRNAGGIDAVEADWAGGPAGGTGAVHPLLDWVIVGGESGPNARPMDIAWAEQIVEQCRTAGVAAFVKQLGIRWGPNHHDIDRFPDSLRVRDFPEADHAA